MAAQEGSRGVTVKDVAAQDFVIAYAAHLKRIGKIEVPKWADLVKTAAFKELAPYDQDWYYIRAGGPWPSRDSPSAASNICSTAPSACVLSAVGGQPALPGLALCWARDRPLPNLGGRPSGRAAAWVGRQGRQGMRPFTLSLPGGLRAVPACVASCDRAPGVLAGRCGCGRFQEDLRRPRSPWHQAREVRDRLRSHRPAHPQAARGPEDRRAHPGGQGGPPQGVRRSPWSPARGVFMQQPMAGGYLGRSF